MFVKGIFDRGIGDRGGANGGSERRVAESSLALRTPFGVRRMRPMMECTEVGRCLQMRSLVSSGQVAKKLLSIALQMVDLAGNPAVA